MIPYKQLSLADIFQDCQDKFENDKPAFLSLLESHIDIDEMIPVSFRNHFYARAGRTCKYPLHAMLWALVIQRIFSIPTNRLLLTFLHYSKPLRDFCGFTKVPDASKITRFKQGFLDALQTVFDNLVDVTEPICQAIDPAKAGMTIFDSPGIEAFVTENNPKYANKIIKQLKAYAKAMNLDKSYDLYKAAYGTMPPHASANPEIKQLYINGHFCYVFKFGIITNGLGIIRYISFYNKDFMASHPDIVVGKKSDSHDEDKSVHDSRLLIPTLKDFFLKHPLINPKTFLGDAAFDAVQLYKALLTGGAFGNGRHFQCAYIPLNARARFENTDYTVNENFPYLNRRYLMDFYRSDKPRLWNGYLLIAIDGSKAEVPNSKENRETFGNSGNQHSPKGQVRALVSGMYDILNHFYLGIEIGHISVSENELAKRNLGHLSEMGIRQPVLAAFDRGYPSIEFIDFLETEGIHYLIRLSSNDYKAEREQMQPADGSVHLKHTSPRLQKIRKKQYVLPIRKLPSKERRKNISK